jgi:phosphatidyl-myo-inositol dimannoside synthase
MSLVATLGLCHCVRVLTVRFLAIVPEAFGGFGGIAVYNRDFLTALAELSLCEKVTVLPRLIRQAPEMLPPRIELLEKAANSRMRYVSELVRVLIKRRRYDVVLCGHIYLLPLAVMASFILGTKQVLLIYGVDAWSPTRRLSDRLVARTDLVISISHFTKQRFLSWSTVRNNQVRLLPNAIHLEEYGVGEKPHYLERRYGLEGKKVLMTLGRLLQSEQQKGIDEILEILPALLAEESNLNYLIVGDGDDKQRLERKAASLGLSKHVVFAGRVPEAEKADHYRVADVFVMAGRQEGFGFVFLEAMASGIPVVASSLDGSREAVLDGELGELANPDDREALKTAIRRALRRPRQIPAGLAFFSYENFRERLRDIISSLRIESVSSTV